MPIFEYDCNRCGVSFEKLVRNVAIALPLIILASTVFGATGAAAATSLTTLFLVAAMAATLQAHSLPVWRNLWPKDLSTTGVH